MQYYTLVTGTSREQLVENVNGMLAKGWKLNKGSDVVLVVNQYGTVTQYLRELVYGNDGSTPYVLDEERSDDTGDD